MLLRLLLLWTLLVLPWMGSRESVYEDAPGRSPTAEAFRLEGGPSALRAPGDEATSDVTADESPGAALTHGPDLALVVTGISWRPSALGEAIVFRPAALPPRSIGRAWCERARGPPDVERG